MNVYLPHFDAFLIGLVGVVSHFHPIIAGGELYVISTGWSQALINRKNILYIPRMVVYRILLQTDRSDGFLLLVVDKIEITVEGKKSSLFRTVLKSFKVKYEYNNVSVEAEQNFDTLKKITEKSFSLDR